MLPTPSRLSVRFRPVRRLRHWYSSTSLRISPLHVEFPGPLRPSSSPVSRALWGLSPHLAPRTQETACARFTPSHSGQRWPPTYYRGCWHVVSRGFLRRYRLGRSIPSPTRSSRPTELYNPKTVFAHAALLRQACAHCGRFPTAASRRSLGRVAVPVWPVALSGRLRIVALVGRHPANRLMRRGPLAQRSLRTFPPPPMPEPGPSGLSTRFQALSRSARQVAHVFLTRPPLPPGPEGPGERSTCMY